MAIHIKGATIDSITEDTGSSRTDFITSDRTLTLAGSITETSGTGAAGSLDIFLVGGAFGTGKGTLVGSVSVSDTGSWTFNLATSSNVDAQSLADGTYTIRLADPETQNTSLATQTLSIDTTGPDAPVITSVTDHVAPGTGIVPIGNSTNDTTPTVNTTAAVDESVTIFGGKTQLGTVIANDSGALTFTTPTLPSVGTLDFTAIATDVAGNVSPASDAYTIIEDPSAVCYVGGTRILTVTGEQRIENLAPGDLVLAHTGEELTPRPVRWLGRRRIDHRASAPRGGSPDPHPTRRNRQQHTAQRSARVAGSCDLY
jgi:VCBS repeat-containing protein